MKSANGSNYEIPEALLPFLNEARNTFGKFAIVYMDSGDTRFVGRGDFYNHSVDVLNKDERT